MTAAKLLAFLAAILLAGCAHKSPPTLGQLDNQVAENKKEASRLYKGKSIDQVKTASQKVLYLLDPPDMKFDVQDGDLLASRFNTFYAVFSVGFGRDWYSVSMRQLPGGVESKFGLKGEMNAGVFVTPIPLSFKSNIPVSAHDNPADFKLFHDRVECVLGINPVWPTCEQAKKESPDKTMLLCDSIGLENLAPKDLDN